MESKLNVLSIAMLSAFLLCSGCRAEDKPEAAPATTNETDPSGAKSIFQPSAIDPALVRQSMQARSEYEEMNRKVIARTSKLYEENPEIKDLQAKMRDLQKKIDALLSQDEELNALKKKFQSIAPDIPAIPRKGLPTAAPNKDKAK